MISLRLFSQVSYLYLFLTYPNKICIGHFFYLAYNIVFHSRNSKIGIIGHYLSVLNRILPDRMKVYEDSYTGIYLPSPFFNFKNNNNNNNIGTIT